MTMGRVGCEDETSDLFNICNNTFYKYYPLHIGEMSVEDYTEASTTEATS